MSNTTGHQQDPREAKTVKTSATSTPSGHRRSEVHEPLLDIRALAEWLSMSEHTLRKWAARGPESGLMPPMLRINGQWRFRPDDVRAWLQSREVR